MGTSYRDAAGKKALEAGIQNSFIRQYGKKTDCDAYVMYGTWAAAWGDPKPIITKKPAPVATRPAITKAIPAAPYEQTFDFMSESPIVKPSENITSPDAVPVTTADTFKMQFSTFPHLRDSTATPLVLSKTEFIDLMAARHIRPGKDGKLFAPAVFKGSRSNDNFISADGICLDFDHGQPTIDKVLELFLGTQAAYYSTHSHTSEKPRFRVVIPLERSVNAEEHGWLVKGIKSIISSELMECLDTGCFDRARAHYLPSCPEENEKCAFTGHQDGDPLNVKYFIRLGKKAASATLTGGKITSMFSTDAIQSAPGSAALRIYDYTISTNGEIINLADWAAQNPAFDLINAIDKQYWRGSAKDGKQHIVCPFEDQHTEQGDDKATFVANASPPQYTSFVVHCCHTHCVGRDRLEFIQAMLKKGWLSADLLNAPAVQPQVKEMKRPPYINYRAQEIAAQLVKQPLHAEEFQYHLHLMHVACTAYDGTLPDDAWIISRILGIDEDQWLKVKPTLVRSGWLVVEGNRIFNPITKREYHISQKELAQKIAGGKTGGLITQQRKREREAHLKG